MSLAGQEAGTPQAMVQQSESLSRVDPDVYGGLGNVPQWKREFLEKKRELLKHQQEVQRKGLLNNNSNGKQAVAVTHKSEDPNKFNLNGNQAIHNDNGESNNNKAIAGGVVDNGYHHSVQPVYLGFAVSNGNRETDYVKQMNNTTNNEGDNDNLQLIGIGSHQLKNMDNGEDENNASADSDSDEDGGKTGGYSVLTGERFSCGDSESSEELDSPETEESETEGSTDLKYQPGFVSKLLSKWSAISYQTDRRFSATSHSSTVGTSSKFNGANVPKTHIPKSNSADSIRVNPTSMERLKTVAPSKTTQPQRKARSMIENKSTDKEEMSTDLMKLTFHRDLNDIILIESQPSKDSSPRSSEESTSSPMTSPTVSTPPMSTPLASAVPVSPPSPTRSSTTSIPNKNTHNANRTVESAVPQEKNSVDKQSDWPEDLPVRDKVLLARAVFESNKGPVAPPRRRRPVQVVSPLQSTTQVPPSSSVSNQLSESKTRPKTQLNGKTVTVAPGDKPGVTSPDIIKPAELTSKQSSTLRSKVSPQKDVVKQPEPLFTSVKLKQTRHKLYETKEDNSLSASSSLKLSSPPGAPSKTRETAVPAKKTTEPKASAESTANIKAPVSTTTNIKASVGTTTNLKAPVDTTADIKTPVSNTADIKAPADRLRIIEKQSPKQPPAAASNVSPNGTLQKTVTNSDKSCKVSLGTNHKVVTDSSSSSPDGDSKHIPTNHSHEQASSANISSTEQKIIADDTIDKSSPIIGKVSDISTSTLSPSNQKSAISLSDIPNSSSPVISNTATSGPHRPSPTVTPSKPQQKVASPPQKTQSKESSTALKVKTVKSLGDIPGPSNKKITPPTQKDDDLQVVLRKRKEKSAAQDDIPFTNIDDMLKPRQGGGGRVFDTRKSMGSKRKVPEYEKIREGPVLQFVDDKVVVGKGCLKVPSANTMKKSLSFNDLDPVNIHEYPSEKVMIRDTPRDKGAVYWDDPDHMQAAPDRSVDEPEPESTKSSLRSSLKGGSTIIKGSLATHKSSYHGDYSFGQNLVSPAQELPAKEDNSVSEAADEAVSFKPANEHEVKSWSSTDSSDMLF